jgi:glycosyltransferase involved in cell wall biosynthesis
MGRGVRAGAVHLRPRESFARIGDAASAEYPELACLRGRLPDSVLDRAQERAERVGTGADRALIAAGVIAEEDYVRALADWLGLEFAALAADDPPCALAPRATIARAALGLMPIAPGEEAEPNASAAPGLEAAVVVAPVRLAARGLCLMAQRRPALVRHFRLTTTQRMRTWIARSADAELARHATHALPAMLSAAPPRRLRAWALAPAILALGLALAPQTTAALSGGLLTAMFTAWIALRCASATIAAPAAAPMPRVPENELPTYSIVAALYREAASVDGLLRALGRLDYPAEKLDVILAVEADDAETRAAIERRSARLPVSVVVAPPGGPRTKPKALNAALPFARGAFVVIYDAEDRPEPDQLRRAHDAFARGGARLGCVQARLSIDNTEDGWLTRLFTAEYAGQFDVFLDGLTALRLPLPLGGSSNHFRTRVLRKVGGWDAYNVTEDADLGMRLARLGYRSEMIASTTYEEAPARFSPWLRQRTRWFKGWMQTWAVHMRAPLRLWREMGWTGFLAFQLVVGGNVLAALVHPLFIGGFAIAAGARIAGGAETVPAAMLFAYGAFLLGGYAASALLCWLGLARRGLARTARVLWLMPLHWLLLSLAAWRALGQLAGAPYAWEKTEHGLAKNSRLERRTTQALLALERHLSALRQDELPPIGERRPPPRARGRAN